MSKGNFYSLSDINNACPDGWRLPTLSEWEEYFFTQYNLTKKKNKIVKKYISRPDGISAVFIKKKKLNIFKDKNRLHIFPAGGVEGNVLTTKKTGNILGVQSRSK